MKTILYLLISLMALFPTISCQEDTPIAPSEYDFTELKALIDAEAPAFGGNVVVILEQDGQRIFEYQKGTLTPNSVRPIASATKWVSGAVLLALAGKGLLDLDQRIDFYLPEFKNTAKGAITVRQCFTITTGLDECSGLEPNCITDADGNLGQVVQQIAAQTPLIAAPGAQMNYGGVGMHIGGRIAEVVTGKPWAQVFQEQIGGPCGMENAMYGGGTNPGVAGSLRTSPNEYLKFLEMVRQGGQLQGNTIIAASAYAEWWKDQQHGAKVYASPYPHNPPFHPYNADTIRYGFGNWQDVVTPNTGYIEQLSSPGAFGTYPWYDRKNDLTGIIFTVDELKNVMASEFKILAKVREIVEKK